MEQRNALNFNLKKIFQIEDINKRSFAFHSFLYIKKGILGINKLTETEKLAYYLDLLDESVQADGFYFFFDSIGIKEAEATVKYLEKVNLPNLTAILKKASKAYISANKQLESIADRKSEQYRKISDEMVDYLNKCDKEYYHVYKSEQLGKAILEYIDDHAGEIKSISTWNLAKYYLILLIKRRKLLVNLVTGLLLLALLRLIIHLFG